MTVELHVTAGPHMGRAFKFTEHSTFIVGRSTQAYFSLPDKDPHVSRLHMLIEVNPPLCRLRNLSAVNGTVVNGAKVEQADLKDGDRITIGVTELTVRMIVPAAGDAVPTVELPTPVSASDPVPLHTAAGAPPVTLPLPAALPDATRTGGPRLASEVLTISGYQLVRVLGRGGMGVVYEATREATGERVAVKTILPNVQASPNVLGKFLREADIVRQLDHPGIVRFIDSGDANGTAWFAMEFVAGADAQALASPARLPAGRAVNWIVQVLEALQYAHDRGFVHRDVKPSNLLVADGPAGTEVVKLADFGLARAYEASPLSGLTMTNTAGGTPSFMPPEQVRDMRSAKPAADQYSAAATLYPLLTGHNVFPQSENVRELLVNILESEPSPITTHNPDLPAGLVSAIHRALLRAPEARHANCRALATALSPFAN